MQQTTRGADRVPKTIAFFLAVMFWTASAPASAVAADGGDAAAVSETPQVGGDTVRLDALVAEAFDNHPHLEAVQYAADAAGEGPSRVGAMPDPCSSGRPRQTCSASSSTDAFGCVTGSVTGDQLDPAGTRVHDRPAVQRSETRTSCQ